MSGTPSPLSSPSSSPRRSFAPLRPIHPPASSSRPTRRSPRSIIKPKLSLDRIAEESNLDGDSNVIVLDPDYIPSTATSSTLSTPALERVKFSWSEPDTVMYAGTPPRRNKVESRRDGWNGKKGIQVGSELKGSCGICFESAVRPNKTRCCGQLFCYQHLFDWLSAQGSDGRCPTCRVPCSIETDTVNLHPPPKPTRPQPIRRRSRSPRNISRTAVTPSAQQESPRSMSPDLDADLDRESSGSSTTSYDVDSSDTSSEDNDDFAVPQLDTSYPSLSTLSPTLSPSSSQRQLILLSQTGAHYESFLWGDLGRVFTLVGAVIVFCALIPVVVYD